MYSTLRASIRAETAPLYDMKAYIDFLSLNLAPTLIPTSWPIMSLRLSDQMRQTKKSDKRLLRTWKTF